MQVIVDNKDNFKLKTITNGVDNTGLIIFEQIFTFFVCLLKLKHIKLRLVQ